MSRSRGMEFCCCALPLVNIGAYMLVLEAAFVSLVIAVLALAPPPIVATMGAIPSWSKWIMTLFAIVTFVWQILGLISIIKQKTTLYRTYIRVNFILTLVIILVALAFLAVSAIRHSTALNTCKILYGNTPAGNGSGLQIAQATNALSSTGSTICNIFIWVQVGIMGLIVVLIGITQLYMCSAQRAYGQHQREAEKASRLFPAHPIGDDIPLAPRDSGVWEPREDAYVSPSHERPTHHDYYNNTGGYDSYESNPYHRT